MIILVAKISVATGNLDSKQTGGQTTVQPDTEIALLRRLQFTSLIHFCV